MKKKRKYKLTRTAMPLRSEPALAAVGDVLGTLSVDVSEMKIISTGMLRARLATWSILVCNPWPISVPP